MPDVTDTATDAQDGGWSMESASAPATPAPFDTTADLKADEAPVVEATGDETHGSEGVKEPVKEPTKEPVKAKPSYEERKRQESAKRYKENERLRHEAERTLAAERTQRQELERRLAALEAGSPSVHTPDPALPTAVAMPDHPAYADFQTDEEYQAAVGSWRTAVATWQANRDAALKADIASSVDTRLKQDRDGAAQREYQDGVVSRLRTMAEAHPEFTELMEANAEVFRGITSPLLHDLIQNTPEGAEFLLDLAKAPEMAQALGALPLPTRPLADALRDSSATRALMKHFATEEGREDFLRLRTLHPITVIREIGRLEARLETAVSGSVPAHPITSAMPAAKPPVGSPRARDATPAAGPSDFGAWMVDEDAKDLAKRRRDMGLSA